MLVKTWTERFTLYRLATATVKRRLTETGDRGVDGRIRLSLAPIRKSSTREHADATTRLLRTEEDLVLVRIPTEKFTLYQDAVSKYINILMFKRIDSLLNNIINLIHLKTGCMLEVQSTQYLEKKTINYKKNSFLS